MSVITWTRIEPDTQTGDPQRDLDQGIAARLADPLWLLGRQWQLGEWQGENGGSPISAQISATAFNIDSLQTAPASTAYARAATAAAAFIENDGGPADIATRTSGGQVFLDRLAEANFASLTQYRTAAQNAYAFDAATATTASEAILMRAAGVDGDRILADAKTNKLAAQLSISTADAPAFTTLVAQWSTWYSPRAAVRANHAWVPDRLEYSFSAAATVTEGRVTLNAPEHTGGRIEWDTFTASDFAPQTAPQPKLISVTAMPLLLHVPGMPSPWFWEIEDPTFDAGQIQAGPSDTARLLLIEATLAYATDWFLVPLRIPVASLSRVDSVQITDTFGVVTAILPTEHVQPHADWALWRVTQGAAALPYLLLPPPDAPSLISDPVEEVAILRDEAANVGWALHRVPAGAPVPSPLQGGPGDLVYVPMTPLPDDRIPLLLSESAGERFLVRGQMVDEPPAPPTPLLPAKFQVRDEEVPDEGLLLQRRFKLARTPDGALHLWLARETIPGARALASGLTFDRLDPGSHP